MNAKGLLLLAAVVSVAVCPPAIANVELDQEYTAPNANIGPTPYNLPVDWAQTFTVGKGGALDRIEIKGHRANLPIEPLLVDIRTTVGGVPSESNAGANILGSVSIAPAAVPPGDAYIVADFSSQSILLSVGQVLAIVTRSQTGSSPVPGYYELRGTSPGGYAGGTSFVRIGVSDTWHAAAGFPTLDIGFRTYVNTAIPEPSSMTLLMLAGGIMSVRIRK